MHLLEFPSPKELLHTLRTKGSLSFPLLSNTARLELLEEAVSYPYKERKPFIEKYNVIQCFSAFSNFPETSRFLSFADIFQKILIKCLGDAALNAFPTPLLFNDFVLQRYNAGSVGISPHRDGSSRINLVAVVLLAGYARFCICRDREGNDAEEIPSPPGNVILMCAPGFFGEEKQLFHFVSDITTCRYTFGMRQWMKR